jgi:hypothetical protein
MPVGIKQKETVNKIVEKVRHSFKFRGFQCVHGIPLMIHILKRFQFPAENFTIMLFHYDGIVDEWNMFPWSSRSIHVVAVNQTKWYCFLPFKVCFNVSDMFITNRKQLLHRNYWGGCIFLSPLFPSQ